MQHTMRFLTASHSHFASVPFLPFPQDASLLRFFVDMRGEDCTNRQLRDDLMTMLIAGHETTAAVLTWATFQLAQVGGNGG